MAELYPSIEPYQTHTLKVDPPHELYIEECGNPDGQPVIMIHGGPGGGCTELDRRLFNPERYRIILMDQRGCGRSSPSGELQHNTTQHLIDDLERIRELLQIPRWSVSGGSWGSTLSLVYAQTHPDVVQSLVLRGIYLFRQQDIDWLYGGQGCNLMAPDYWDAFISHIPESEHNDLVSAYYQRLTSTDDTTCRAAALAWSMWEGRCATLQPNEEVIKAFASDELSYCFARLCCHYFQHKGFLKPNQILLNMEHIQHIPGIIVHGRYDIICAPEHAWTLHQSWSKSELRYIDAAGHSSNEPGIHQELVQANNDILEKLN